MERRNFLKKTLISSAAAGGLLAGCTSSTGGPAVHTNPTVRWRLASSFPRSLDTIFGAADILSRRLDELTGGRFKITPFPAGELVPGLEVLDAVRQKTAEIGHSASYYYVGKEPALAFDCSVPFGLNTRQQSAWLSQAGGLQLMRELFANFGIVNLPGGNTGVQMGGWFRNRVDSLADLNGLKMRIPGLGGKVMNELGVTVQVIPGGEIYPALERGTIDATEWVGPYDDQKLGFHRVAKNYYYPGWWEPGPALSFYVNQEAWDKLPSSYRSALEVAAAEAAHAMQMEYDAKNPPALQGLIASGVTLRPFPEDVMKAAERAFDEYTADMVGKNPAYRKVHEHWSAFKKTSDRWFATAEKAYTNFAYRNL